MSASHTPVRVHWVLPLFGFALVLAALIGLIVIPSASAAPPPPPESARPALLNSAASYPSGQPLSRILSTNAPVVPTRVAPSFQPPSESFAAAQRAPGAGPADTTSLLVRANRAHDWVQGEAPSNTNVFVTVKRSGQVIGTGQSSTGGGTGWNVNPQRPEGGNVDMLAGDVVEVAAGVQSASVELIDMDGWVNATTDVVNGKLSGVPFPADVRVEVWRNNGQNRDLKTEDDGDFSIDFDTFDIHQGDQVGIWYVRPDGHMVGIVRSDFRLEAELRDNDIWGMTTPNTRVNLTLLSGGTVKGTTTAWSDREGNYGTDLRDALGQRIDIQAGDIINGAAGVKTATMTIPQPFSASYDHDANTVCGQAPAGVQVQVDLWGFGSQNATANGSNNYCATFGGNPGIDAEGETSFSLPAGHRALVRFRTPTPALWLNKWSDGQPPSGGYHRYTLRVGNDERADMAASDAVLTDVLPAGMTYVSANPSPATVTGNTVVWHLDPIAPGTERDITLTVRVNASVSPGTELENCTEVKAAGWERDTGNNMSCDRRQVTQNEADLSVGGGVSPGDPAPGADYVYQIQYNNNRPAGSRNVRITETMPTGTTFVSEWHPAGWTVDTSQTGKIIWQTDYLPGWNGRYLELNLRVNSDAIPGTTQLHNRVEIAGDAPDADTNNNVWENDAGVKEPYGNVSVGKSYSHGIPVAGYEYSTWVQVWSHGNVSATGVELTDTLPAGATFVRATQYTVDPATGDRDVRTNFPPAAQGPGWVRWNLPAVPNWRDFQMEVTFRIGASTIVNTELVNQVDVALPGDQDPSNNHAEYRFRTQATGPNLRVTKWYDWGDVAPGGNVQYQLRFENDGTAPLYDLVFKDILPDHTTLNGYGWGEQPTIEGQTLTWKLNWQMDPGDQHGFWLQVRVNDGTPAGTILTNTAQGSSSTTEELGTDNSAPVTLAVGPDLRVEKELMDEGIRPGHRARYRIRIWNDGHAQARNIVLTDILPPGLTFVRSDWGGDVQAGNQVVWHIGDRGPDWRGEFNMEVDAAPNLPVGSAITNRLEITNDAGDANPADNDFELASTISSPYLFRVQESHNWVNGEALPNTPVHIVLKDHLGVVKGTNDVTPGDDGSFFAGGFPDIVPGDTVEVTPANASTIVIPVMLIDGTLDVDANSIAGKVHGVSDAKVLGEVWAKNGPRVEDLTDGAGNYGLSFAPFDVRNGHSVALWYVRPDGHQVGIVRQALFVRVYPADDNLWGSTAPNTTVNVTLRSAADVLKGSATVTSGSDGNWSTDIHNGATRVEIDDHDKLHVTAGGLTVDLVVPRITVLPDAPHDRVDIYSELPNTGLDLRWDSSPNLDDHDWAHGANTTTDGTGHASLDVGPQGGLDLGVAGNLQYYDADGQSIEPWWRAMVDAVSPPTLLNTADRTITLSGVGFTGTPAVYLGKGGANQIQLTSVTLVGGAGTGLQATVPAGVPAGVYDLLVYNPDERIGFLANALTIRGWWIRLPLIIKSQP